MADETERQLGEAVIPSTYSLPSKEQADLAKLKLTTEGWARDERLPKVAPSWPESKSPFEEGSIPLVKNGNTVFGLTFGRGNSSPDERDKPVKQGKSAGVYFGMKW